MIVVKCKFATIVIFVYCRHYYVMFMVWITFLNLISIPMEIAYSEEAYGMARKCWKVFNVASDTIFMVDVILAFRMGSLTDGSQV